MISTKDIKKGMPIKLKSGWCAVMMDNRRGNIRMAEVDGIFKEIGSIYASEIIEAFVDGKWQHVTHSMRKGHAEIPNFLYGGF